MICLRPEAEAFAVAVVSYGMPWVRDGIFFFGVEAEIEIERSVERGAWGVSFLVASR